MFGDECECNATIISVDRVVSSDHCAFTTCITMGLKVGLSGDYVADYRVLLP